MRKLNIALIICFLTGFWSCADNSNVKTATLLVTTNVRGQLDPCG